jgi:hypothetical protein
MDGDLVDTGQVAVELLAEEFPGLGVTEEISRE